MTLVLWSWKASVPNVLFGGVGISLCPIFPFQKWDISGALLCLPIEPAIPLVQCRQRSHIFMVVVPMVFSPRVNQVLPRTSRDSWFHGFAKVFFFFCSLIPQIFSCVVQCCSLKTRQVSWRRKLLIYQGTFADLISASKCCYVAKIKYILYEQENKGPLGKKRCSQWTDVFPLACLVVFCSFVLQFHQAHHQLITVSCPPMQRGSRTKYIGDWVQSASIVKVSLVYKKVRSISLKWPGSNCVFFFLPFLKFWLIRKGNCSQCLQQTCV